MRLAIISGLLLKQVVTPGLYKGGGGMAKLQLFFQSLIVILAVLFHLSHADVGTAAHYRTPYLPTACYGNDATQFPSSNLFGSAGEGIWDNGAACGRQYLVRCISAAHPRTCIPGQTIQIKIVDRALSSVSRPSRHGATIVLSKTAFGMIAKPSATGINIEFTQ
nr:eg45-like domain containing protein [Quercus suber]